MNTTKLNLPSYSSAQTRVMDTALDLFSNQGINGTSLQMIADALGVTKAAVYHQFRTKDEIVIAAVGVLVAELEELIERVDTEPSQHRAREMLIDGLIELAIVRRRSAGLLQRDPVMLRIFEEYKPFRWVMERLDKLLLGDNTEPEARVTVALLLTAIGGVIIHPLVSDVDNDTLRTQLRSLTHSLVRFLE